MVKLYAERFKPNSFIMSDSLMIDASSEEVYQYYIHHYHEIYSQTAGKHHEFVLLNSDSIREGTTIYCREGEENQMIHHDYLVEQVIPGRLIFKSSEPTVIRVKTKKGTRENTCNTYVYVDFNDVGIQKSELRFTIVMQMPNYIYKMIGRILGGKKAKAEWEGHLQEELEGFRNVFYKYNQISY